MGVILDILTTNYIGQPANILFYPCNGGVINLGTVTLPYGYESDDYMKWESFTLSSKNRNSILIPAGYGNAHYILSNEGAIFHYKQTSYYNRIDQFTLNWKDNRVGIYWPCENPILSERDAGNSSF